MTVHYATANGTATAGSDYQAASGHADHPRRPDDRNDHRAVIGDRLAEPNETFFVNLSSPTNATIADGQGVGTIVDDEPRISISDVTKAEGKKGKTTLFTFTVTLSAAYDQAVTMSFRTVNGTATTSDNDYVAKTGTLTFAPGETTKTITIEVKGDSKREADEYFYLDLFGNSSNSLFTKSRGVGTILNDDLIAQRRRRPVGSLPSRTPPAVPTPPGFLARFREHIARGLPDTRSITVGPAAPIEGSPPVEIHGSVFRSRVISVRGMLVGMADVTKS